MSKSSESRSIRTVSPVRLLLLDFGLSETTVQGVCHGLDQLFSVMTSYTGLGRVPTFGLIVNGQTDCQIFLPLSSTGHNHMEVQVALCKLQLLAQQWLIKFDGKTMPSISWHSALHMSQQHLKSILGNIDRDRVSANSDSHEVRLILLTNRLTDSSVTEIHQFAQNHLFDVRNIELIYVNDDDAKRESLKQRFSLLNRVDLHFVSENKYSVGLYFKSWLIQNDNGEEHVRLHLPTTKTDQNKSRTNYPTDMAQCDSHEIPAIRCDLHEILIDPHRHTNHDRFFLYTEPSSGSSSMQPSSPLSLPIYELRALHFIKRSNYCISLIFGMPLLITSNAAKKYDIESREKNERAFDTLTNYLRTNELMMICRLDHGVSMPPPSQVLSGHFIISVASEHSLIIRSIASSELILPPPISSDQARKHELHRLDEPLIRHLATMTVDDDAYNPLLHEARKSQIILNTHLI